MLLSKMQKASGFDACYFSVVFIAANPQCQVKLSLTTGMFAGYCENFVLQGNSQIN